MKTRIITSVVFLAILSLGLASCKTTKIYRRYPSRTSTGHLPPGQEKKLHDDQSAKKYAPGQRKKHD